MSHSLKLLFNTFASSAKIVVNAVATLFATRVALEQLGAADFGLFNLIAGIIVMLSFFSGSLSISGQRFFSIALGQSNNTKLNSYYNSCLGIHLFFSILIIAIFIGMRPLVFGGGLNITSEQLPDAVKIYNILIFSSAMTIFTIPFSAMANAYEDLGIISLADIVSSLIKLTGALLLFLFTDKLVAYALFMLFSIVIKAAIEYAWCLKFYKNLKIHISQFYNKANWHEMLGFVGWNTLASLAVVLRNQGVAVILNIFFGVVINAAYGIANQVNSLILSFASALTTVFAPSIIRSYGAGKLDETRRISILSSKLSFLLSSLMALPILVFLEGILQIWLSKIPEGTYPFTIFIVLSFLVLQLYPGLNRAIYATGKIKGYSVWISIVLIINLPLGYILFKVGLPDYSILATMLFLQILTLIVTIKYAFKLIGINAKNFIIGSVLKPVTLLSIFIIVGTMIQNYFSFYTIIPIICIGLLLDTGYCYLYYRYILIETERVHFLNLFSQIKNKIRK